MPATARRIALATGLHYNVLEWPAAPGAPDDVTFVLVHGFTDLAAGWDAVAERLTALGQVVAPDLRGHGDSDWVGAGGYYYFMDYVADLDDVIAQLARPRVIVVGHSMGGGVVSYWAGSRPARPTALVLVEGIGIPDAAEADPGPRTARWIDAWSGARAHQRVMPTLDAAAARLRKNDALLTEDAALAMAAAGTRPVATGLVWKHDPLHMTVGPIPYRLEVARRYWAAIACPVLIVDGDRSTLNLPHADRASRRATFADHRYVVIEGAGHAVQRHQPEALADAIRAHVHPVISRATQP